MFEFLYLDRDTNEFRPLRFEDSSFKILLSCIYNSMGANLPFRLWYLPDVPKEEGDIER